MATQAMQTWIQDDLDALIETLPPHIRGPLRQREDRSELLEVVLDLGRPPEARFLDRQALLVEQEVTEADLRYVVDRIGAFGDDNRAGIPRTLHRFSAIRNRTGKIVGLTCRVGRAVFGTIRVIEDLVKAGKSVLLLGRPGVGKTTMLREVARVLADEEKRRVVIVDTSNEIAGDGDIPHPAIGSSRRMQVPATHLQHAVMIEAVENHMPQVIIVDEMGTEQEAAAARTIAERGVQLVATAHGNTLENLVMNPTLSDLVGGVQPVTLGDEEARRRGTQKSILERKAPPTFGIVVEIQNWTRVAVHPDVASTVDALLRGAAIEPEVRWVDEAGRLQRLSSRPLTRSQQRPSSLGGQEPNGDGKTTRIHSFGVNREKLTQIAQGAQLPIQLVEKLQDADLVLTTKNYYRRKSQALRQAEVTGKPVFVLRRNTLPQIHQALLTITGKGETEAGFQEALSEAERAAQRVHNGEMAVALRPQESFVRRLQHQIAQQYQLTSRSTGREPRRFVTIAQR